MKLKIIDDILEFWLWFLVAIFVTKSNGQARRLNPLTWVVVFFVGAPIYFFKAVWNFFRHVWNETDWW